jgi:hypothetical protein
MFGLYRCSNTNDKNYAEQNMSFMYLRGREHPYL